MEDIVGVDQIRPQLGKYLKKAADGVVIVITSRSAPQGVLIGYRTYEELKRLSEKAKQVELKAAIDVVREKAEAALLSEEDVRKEIEEVRSCE
jgi:prevent-host-death family protein